MDDLLLAYEAAVSEEASCSATDRGVVLGDGLVDPTVLDLGVSDLSKAAPGFSFDKAREASSRVICCAD